MSARNKILKLAKKISGPTALMIKIDENAPEYYVLDCVVTDEMADVGLAMELRKPQTIQQLAKKCGKSLEETKRLAYELAQVGACIFHEENGEDVFELTVFVPGVMEKMCENKELCETYPAIPRAFEEYARLRGAMLSPGMPIGKGPMRVIPIQSAIDGDSRKIGFEEVSTILNNAKRFAVGDCTCRRSRRLLGQGCGHLEHDVCLQLDSGAEYYIRTGRAREISREEAFEIIKKCEENGLMHSIPNIDNGTTHAICNCCACGCYSMRNAIMFNSPDMVRSNYVSEVNSEKCVACGQCVENCPTNALKLGQKLCSIEPITLKSAKTAHDHILREKDWNVNYRINRKNVVDTGTSPCKSTCPAHIAVQGYIRLAAQGKYTEALDLIKKENPFPAVCGRICPHACESECTRGEIDQPIAIDEIKKFIADQELRADVRFVPKKRYNYSDKKIAIVGAGPAGLSCAYYLALDGYAVTVFEKHERLGGMLTLGIPSFRLEKDVIDAEIQILREMGVEFKIGVEVGKDVTLDDLRAQGYKGFYLAIGAQAGRKLGIEGEDAEGVIAGVDFLRNVNLGNETKLSGKVVVIGGGNVAIDVARTAVRENAETVAMYCLESASEMPALPDEIEEANAENIKINNGWGPKRIIVEDGKVTGVEFKKCVSVFDNGKFSPKYDENEVITVSADYVLLSVGQSIDWGNLLENSKVELGRGNVALADGFTYQTAQPDIFVGGDVYSGPKFAIDAIAAGKQGAISLHRFVWEGQSLVYGRDRREYISFDKSKLDEKALRNGYDNTPRQIAGRSHAEGSFADMRLTFTEEQMKKETQRCLDCGAVKVDTVMCVGCGMCTTKCMFDAIKLVRKYNEYATTYEKLPLKMAPNMVKRIGKTAVTAAKEVITGEK